MYFSGVLALCHALENHISVQKSKCIVSPIITLRQFLHKGMNGQGWYWRHTLVKGMWGCRVDQSPLPFFICHQHWCKENRSGVSMLSSNVAEHHAFLCSRGFRWFAVTAIATGLGKAGWGVGAGVMDIFVWCGRWDEKTVGELLLPASLSLCQICTLLLSFDQQKMLVKLHVHEICPLKGWPLAHLCFANKQQVLLLCFYCCNLWHGCHTSYIMNEFVCALLSVLSGVKPVCHQRSDGSLVLINSIQYS